MDPNATISELLKIAKDQLDESDNDPVEWRADRMAELFADLDQWICRGGFLPRRWESRKTNATADTPP